MRRAFLAAAAVHIGACSFFDPLDQAGLNVLVIPPDTGVYVGNSYQAVGLMVNSHLDVYPSEHIEYAGPDPQVTVTRGGRVTGVSFGRARVVARRGDLRDTGWVSVVPMGTIALSAPSRIDIMGVDGSNVISFVSAGQATGGNASFLPGNGGIVFQYAVPGGAGARRLVFSDLTGTTTRVLDSTGQNPRVSRDGSWVYYDKSTSLWRVHLDGTGREQVTPGNDVHPDPSPDGLRLVFVRHRPPPGETFQVVVRVLAAGTDTLLATDAFYPRWSPAGDSIAYWAGDQFTRVGALYVMAANGSGVRQVSQAGITYRPEGLDWSPDGAWLLAPTGSGVHLVRVATGLTIPVGYAPGYSFPSWRW